MQEQENERLKQIDLSIIGVIIFIFILLHSIYLLVTEKKKILDIETISDEKLVLQSLLNRIIAFLVIFMFFYFAYSNYISNLNDNNESNNSNGFLNLIVSGLTLIAVIIEIYSSFQSYIDLKENQNNDN